MQQQWPPPRAPQKKGIGCVGWGVILLGAGFVLLLVVTAFIPRKGPSAAEERRLIEANEADAAAQRMRAIEEEWRKGCKTKPPEPLFVVLDSDLRDRCEAMISERLKVPGSGSFPSEREQPTALVSNDNCTRIFQSYVDAKNAFGVKVRTRYECSFDPRTGLYSTKTSD